MKQLPSLNGLRAVSIGIVILDHLLQFNLRLGSNVRLFVLSDGRFGVNVFFVISGFLITSLLLEEEKDAGKISVRNFYVRRILRIFPAYYFLLLTFGYLQLIGYLNVPPIFWIMLLTYTRYIRIRGEDYTGHAWSLSVEENFYFLWPAAFRAGDRQRKGVALFFVVIGPLVRTFLFLHPVEWIGTDSLFVRIAAIAMGCLVALHRDKLLQWLTPRWPKLLYPAIIALFLLSDILRFSNLHGFGVVFVPFGGTIGSISNLVIALIMLYSVYGPQGIWYKLLNSKPFNFLGILSYSMYLWQ